MTGYDSEHERVSSTRDFFPILLWKFMKHHSTKPVEQLFAEFFSFVLEELVVARVLRRKQAKLWVLLQRREVWIGWVVDG